MSRTRHISFRSEGRSLSGYLFEPEPARLAGSRLLFVHGLRSHQAGYRARAEVASARLGAVCLTFDLSGHGESAGNLVELSAQDHLRDLLAAHDLLVSQEAGDPGRTGVCAASYGAYLAALLTSHRSVERLLLRAPALYSDADLDTPFGTSHTAWQAGDGSIALANLARYEGEVLIVESGRDEVVPRTTVDAYRAACRRASYHVIPEATHALADPAWQGTFLDLIVSWFAEL